MEVGRGVIKIEVRVDEDKSADESVWNNKNYVSRPQDMQMT